MIFLGDLCNRYCEQFEEEVCTYYYNSDWYYACEEMQELFRETANELAD